MPVTRSRPRTGCDWQQGVSCFSCLSWFSIWPSARGGKAAPRSLRGLRFKMHCLKRGVSQYSPPQRFCLNPLVLRHRRTGRAGFHAADLPPVRHSAVIARPPIARNPGILLTKKAPFCISYATSECPESPCIRRFHSGQGRSPEKRLSKKEAGHPEDSRFSGSQFGRFTGCETRCCAVVRLIPLQSLLPPS